MKGKRLRYFINNFNSCRVYEMINSDYLQNWADMDRFITVFRYCTDKMRQFTTCQANNSAFSISNTRVGSMHVNTLRSFVIILDSFWSILCFFQFLHFGFRLLLYSLSSNSNVYKEKVTITVFPLLCTCLFLFVLAIHG